MRKPIFILTIALAGWLTACTSLRPDPVEIVSLGIVPESIEIPALPGEDGVRMMADRDYSVEVLSGSEWFQIGLVARDTLAFSFKENNGFRRSARIRVSADGREDELLVKQEGPFREWLQLSQNQVDVPASGSSVSLRVHSNLPSDYFAVSTSHESAIGSLSLSSYELSFKVLPTVNRDRRTYTVTVSYIDGWGDELSRSLSVTQEAYD